MLGTRWLGGVSPPTERDTKLSVVSLSGETPPSQPARRQRSGNARERAQLLDRRHILKAARQFQPPLGALADVRL